MTTMGDLIREHRLRKGMTQGELATALGYANALRTNISNVENGSYQFPVAKVFRLCEILDIPIENLMAVFPDSPSYNLLRDVLTSRTAPVTGTAGAVTEVYDIRGVWRKGDVVGTIPLATWMLEEVGLAPDTVFAVRVDDSLEPEYPAGTLLLCDLAGQPEQGRPCAVKRNDEALLIKRWVPLPDGSVRLRSDNPVYADILLSPAEIKQVAVYPVVGCVRKV